MNERANKGNVFRRSDSIIHVGLGVATAVVGPILAVPYGLYLWNRDSGGSDCSVFVQGIEYGAGYVIGSYLIGQLFAGINQ